LYPWKVPYLSNSEGQKNRLEMLPVLRIGVEGTLYQDRPDKMRELQGTIKRETNFIRIYDLKYIFLSSNILFVSLHIIELK